ncbi:SDR family oxidoreductase [Patescibacteria group bacterium AH-259-L07]|nr:SDR family oxidoreductase [Patescibacteria group bacterium AH-259-L07]
MHHHRVIIVTGSSRGIGEATAVEFLKHGDSVVVFCRHRDHVEEAEDRLRRFANADQILGLTGDVRKFGDVKRIVTKSLTKFGRIDVLVNNAGIAVWKLVEETSEKEWDDVLATNLKGAYLFMREVVPLMKGQGDGIIINISSGLGAAGDTKYSAYSSSKFGLIGLTQCVAQEIKNPDIKVYAALPGAVATKLHLDIHPWEDPKDMLTPEYVGRKIFKLAQGERRSGASVEIYG